jgi:dsRNA-specific ribonuclease
MEQKGHLLGLDEDWDSLSYLDSVDKERYESFARRSLKGAEQNKKEVSDKKLQEALFEVLQAEPQSSFSASALAERVNSTKKPVLRSLHKLKSHGKAVYDESTKKWRMLNRLDAVEQAHDLVLTKVINRLFEAELHNTALEQKLALLEKRVQLLEAAVAVAAPAQQAQAQAQAQAEEKDDAFYLRYFLTPDPFQDPTVALKVFTLQQKTESPVYETTSGLAQGRSCYAASVTVFPCGNMQHMLSAGGTSSIDEKDAKRIAASEMIRLLRKSWRAVPAAAANEHPQVVDSKKETNEELFGFSDPFKDPVSSVLNYSQKHKKEKPSFVFVGQEKTGASSWSFKVLATLEAFKAEGVGPQKKHAKAAAAAELIKQIVISRAVLK